MPMVFDTKAIVRNSREAARILVKEGILAPATAE